MSKPRLVEFSGGLEDWLKETQFNLGKWRIKFITHMWRFQQALGAKIKRAQQVYVKEKHWETGTMHNRVDFFITQWNSIVFGIIEPRSDYYKIADHGPTDAFLTRYSGWKPSPYFKHYAEFVDNRDPFMERIVDEMYHQQMKDEVEQFMKDNPLV